MGEKSSTILNDNRHHINPFTDFSKEDSNLPVDVNKNEVTFLKFLFKKLYIIKQKSIF